MPPPLRVLSKEQIESIRSASNYQDAAIALGIGKGRAARIKKAKTVEAAMAFAGTKQAVEVIPPPPDIPQEEPQPEEDVSTDQTTKPQQKPARESAAEQKLRQTRPEPIYKTAIVLRVPEEEYIFEPKDIGKCVDEFRDMQVIAGWQSDFSSTLSAGMKLLRSVITHIGEGGNDGRGTGSEEEGGGGVGGAVGITVEDQD